MRVDGPPPAIKIPGLRGGASFALARAATRRNIWEKVNYVPHSGQLAAHRAIDAGARELMVIAGARSGKTRFTSTEAITELAFEPDENASQRLITAAAPYSYLTDKVFGWVWKAVKVNQVLGNNVVSSSETKRYIQMAWGARIEGKTTEDPASLLGEGIVMAILDEDARIKAKVYEEYVERNLLDFDGIAIRITTARGMQNNSTKVYRHWQKLSKTERRYWTGTFSTYQNAHNLKGGKESLDRVIANLEAIGMGKFARQEYLGDIVSLSGAVYPTFNPDFHVKRVLPVEGIPVDLAIDWGFTNPFYCGFCQELPDDRLFIFGEIYKRGLDDQEKAEHVLRYFEQIQELTGKKLELGKGFGDPAAPQAIKTFRKNSIPMYEPSESEEVRRINSIDEGVAVVRGLFGRRDKPAIIIHPRCEKTIEEHEGLEYGKLRDGSSSEKPVKVNDHSTDGTRYICNGKFGGGSRKPLFFSLRDEDDGEDED